MSDTALRFDPRSWNEALAGVIAVSWAILFLAGWAATWAAAWTAAGGLWTSPSTAWFAVTAAACLGVTVWGVGVATGDYFRRSAEYRRTMRALGAVGLAAVGWLVVLTV